MGVAGRTATAADLGDEHGTGATQLREVLAAYLRRVRGAVADPESVFVCAGFRYGLNLLLRALLSEGVTTVAVEDPGPVDHDAIARRPVCTWCRSPSTSSASRWRRSPAPRRVVVVTPAHQAPTGVVLAPERRHELVEWARAVDGFVVEDDYDAEFRYDRQPVGAVQGSPPTASSRWARRARRCRRRCGWDGSSAHRACTRRSVSRSSPRPRRPGLDQLALAALVESGRYDRHLRQMRGVYKSRREALVEALARYAPDVTGLAAGCHARAAPAGRRPRGGRGRRGMASSVAVYGMSRYRSDRGTEPAELVLGFGNVKESAIVDAMRRVAPVPRGGGPLER